MKIFRFFSGLTCLLAVCLSAPKIHAATPANGNEFTPLTTFYNTNGAYLYDAPVFGPDGNLYGTTYNGGTNNAGVVFKVTLAGVQSTLHVFSTNAFDGQNSAAPLVVGPDEALYGTTSVGGTNDAGTIFRITTNGIYTQLYSFGSVTNSSGDDLDGSTPYAGLTLGRDGNFYGITYYGGISNAGTIFQITPGGTLTTLYSFTGGDDGANPYEASLQEGAPGIFYGAAYSGGISNDGTIFQITSGGALTTLWQFTGTNGQGPYARLQFGSDGNLYGTTIQGGASSGGTIFSITTNGDFTLLFEFTNFSGYYPEGGVTPGPFNNLYGVTYNGGTYGEGSMFAFTTNGQYTTMYSFTNGNDGNTPISPLFRDANGNLYGATLNGGKANSRGLVGTGVVFRWTDLFRPTNSFTLPVNGQRWSNIVLNATGTIRENVGVGYVFYSLNGSPWAVANTANAWTNWSAPLVLTPGTNTLQSYAVDVAGNYSTTNTVKFVYVPGFSTALLTVLTNGLGTVTPNYNNALLLIGTNYSMTAKAVTGEAFVNWTDASNNVVSTSTNLNFTMASGLTYVANFKDIAPPTLTITSPKSGARSTNTQFYLIGAVHDNIAVSNVFYSLNSGVWTNATLYNNSTNWYAIMTPVAGSNTIAAYATDTTGNISKTNTVLVDQIPGATLTVIFNGSGTMTPNYSNALLALGNSYTMKAVGNDGYKFYYWKSGAMMITNPSLTFVMATNLTNTANFQDIQAPIITVTTPGSNQKYSNSTINCTGYSYDNSLTIGGVMCQMNGGSWFPASSTSGSYYTWTCSNNFPVNVGNNVFQAYAYDGSGNISKTNVVKFTGVTPPDPAAFSLTNLMLSITGQTNTYDIAFATNTFSQLNFYSMGDSGAGAFAYQKKNTNTGSLQLTFTATPDMTNDNNPQDLALTFTSQITGTFTNSTTTDWGSFQLAQALPYPPRVLSPHIFTNSAAGGTNVTIFKFGTTSVTSVVNGATNSVSDYSLYRPTQPEMLITLTNADDVQYLQLHFQALTSGRYQLNTYDTGGVFQTNEFGTFNMR